MLFANDALAICCDSTARVPCVSCHKADGNGNLFTEMSMKRTAAVTEEAVGGATLTDLCTECHAAS